MNKVNVNIFGKEYTVLGEQNAERIARIAAHVDSKMNEISEAAGEIPVSSIAVLSAMEITDECFTQMDRIEELNLWPGDRIFLRLLAQREEFFSLKLLYSGDDLLEAVLDGQPL